MNSETEKYIFQSGLAFGEALKAVSELEYAHSESRNVLKKIIEAMHAQSYLINSLIGEIAQLEQEIEDK